MKEKSILSVFKRSSFKDNVEPAHWVGRSKLRSLDTDDFFNRTPKFDEDQAGVTRNTVKHSVSGEGDDPVLLQEKEQNVAEETNDDDDEN